MSEQNDLGLIQLSSKKFLAACLIVALIMYVLGRFNPWSPSVVAAEVLLTVLALFVFGSIRYRLDKNALTYGAAMIIVATFWERWWLSSTVRAAIAAEGPSAFWAFFSHYFLTLHGLEQLFHADTMLFILGLTFFVAVIAQTRLLETASFFVLRQTKGDVVPTIATLTAIVAFSSGILDGVSMIGLLIRTMVIILLLSRAQEEAVIYAVLVSTLVTTVCGMWLAYGEPPNLIMKTNLHPHLDNAFFLRFCLPAAVGSYFIVLFNVRKRLKGRRVDLAALDILDQHTADVRFLQAMKHGKVLSPIEFLESKESILRERYPRVLHRLQRGEPLGHALVAEAVDSSVRKEMLSEFFSDDIAEPLDDHYLHENKEPKRIAQALDSICRLRLRAQWIGGISFVPFIGALIWHAMDHSVPLFVASFTGFFVALMGIFSLPKVRALALHEAKHEYMEYIFLFPLFLSIAVLQKTGFFSVLSDLLHTGIERIGASHVAYVQYVAATLLSAMLDNNVVADFASRALHWIELSLLHLFSMAQIAGYAVGGCWTHIGSAQSVVAYSFIQKEVNPRFTPFQWIKAMTPIVLEICVLMSVVIYGESLFLHTFPE